MVINRIEQEYLRCFDAVGWSSERSV